MRHTDDPVAQALQLIHAEQIAQREQILRLGDQMGKMHLLLMRIEMKLTLTAKVYPDDQGE